MRHPKACIQWLENGECTYGSECIYAHDASKRSSMIRLCRSDVQDGSTIPIGSMENCLVPRSVEERYYTSWFYAPNGEGFGNYSTIIANPNGLVLVRQSCGGPAFDSEKRSIVGVRFADLGGVNIENISVSGKKKKSAFKTQCDTIICTLICSDNTEYPLYAGVPGTIIEVNKAVSNSIDLLYKTNSYVVIIKPANDLVQRQYYKLCKDNMK